MVVCPSQVVQAWFPGGLSCEKGPLVCGNPHASWCCLFVHKAPVITPPLKNIRSSPDQLHPQLPQALLRYAVAVLAAHRSWLYQGGCQDGPNLEDKFDSALVLVTNKDGVRPSIHTVICLFDQSKPLFTDKQVIRLIRMVTWFIY